MSWQPPPRHAALATALAVAVVAEAIAAGEGWGAVVSCGVAATSVAWVRRAPLAVAAVVLVAYAAVPGSTNTVLSVLPYLISLGFVGRFASVPASVGIAVGAALVLGLTDVDATKSTSHLIGNLVYYALFSGVIVTGGQLLQYGEHRERELAAVARDIDVTAAERERLAVEAERARIARELHDVIAQAITVIGVHAAVARQALPRDARASASLDRIETATEQASLEMRRLLGLLRELPGDSGPLPHLGRIDELVAAADDSGLSVEVRLDLKDAMSTALDLAAYRIVQEGLSNCRRHAPGSRVTVAISTDHRNLTIEIEDSGSTGHDAADREHGRGFGLIGMRERAMIYDGRLEAMPTAAGGFRVCAVFPLATVSRESSLADGGG